MSTGHDHDLSVSSDAPPGLPELRAQLDAIDRNIIDLLARRLDVCRAVARVKERASARVIQPQRVREVWNSRRRWAASVGVDPGFCEQMFRTLLAETHRIESAEAEGGPQEHPTPPEIAYDSALELSTCRIDHAVVGVADLAAARAFVEAKLGWRVRDERRAERGADTLSVDAGGATLILAVGPSPKVGIAVEVLDVAHARADLEARGCTVSETVSLDNGVEACVVETPDEVGFRLTVLSRTGERAGADGRLA